jgi:hypothetical protein
MFDIEQTVITRLVSIPAEELLLDQSLGGSSACGGGQLLVDPVAVRQSGRICHRKAFYRNKPAVGSLDDCKIDNREHLTI